jgi:EmrB/QacA subfamily drug resistance transporter
LQPSDLGSRARWGVLLTIGLGTFMSALDGSVVNIILPVVRQQFSASVAAVEWVITIYLLVISGLLLSVGRLGDLHGHRSIYAAGFLVFLLGSALCGLSPSVGFLIAARGGQAIGAAMLMANAPAILTKSFPAEMRGRALGLQATMTYLGLTVGPSIGGWLANALGWRWVFYINLPVGTAALLLALRFVPRDGGRSARQAFDLRGAVTFALGLVSLLLALNQGESWGWSSPLTLGFVAGAAVLLLAFLRIERSEPEPMLDLSLFRQRTFSAAAGSAMLNYISLYTMLFLLPFYLLNARGLSTAQAGLLLTAQPLTMAVVAPLSGALSDRIGTRVPSMVGMGLLAVGLWLLSGLAVATPSWVFVFELGLVGLGIGVFVSPNNSALMGAAPHHRQGIAAGTLALARNVGMVLGVAFAGAIYTIVLGQSVATEAGAILDGVRIAYLSAAAIALAGVGVAALRD